MEKEKEYNEHFLRNTVTDTLEFFHLAKQYSDDQVRAGTITDKSDEYYGMWACNASSMLNYYYSWMGIIDKATEYYVLFNSLAMVYCTSFYSSAARTYSQLEYQSIISSNSAFSCIDDATALNQGITDIIEVTKGRRTWRQSELEAATHYPLSEGYKYNPSYKLVNGQLTEVPYGTAGSVRPDYYNPVTNHCVDIKNYTVTTTKGRYSLAKNIEKQYNQRVKVFPENTQYEVMIDVSGQEVTQSMLNDITSRVAKLTDSNVNIVFMY